ncbi:MAG: TerC family protein [Phycisphaerales bacterium]|nr:TerC family protein [Phycisphaerales bacterium]
MDPSRAAEARSINVLELFSLAQTAVETAPAAIGGGGANLKLWAYVGFIGLVILFLALDLGVFHREAHEVSMKEAISWSIVWLTCGVAFSAFVYFAYQHHWLGLGLDTPIYNPATKTDPTAPLIVNGVVDGKTGAIQYLTGYVVEKSLAMDNIFVIALVFQFFAIPGKYQHRVLFWGIIGALIMRGAMIFLGAELIMRYQWILIIFGGFLILTALKMALIKGNDDPSQNIAVKLAKKMFRTVDFFDGQKFFTKRTVKPTYSTDPKTGKQIQDPAPAGTLGLKWAMTPLFLALILVEITDLVFAVDSIPAIFAITPDPFIVFTSNIFAILGLRALYFCLAALIAKFRFLKPALILILAFVGVKLLLLSVPPYLGVIGLEAQRAIKIDPILSLVIVVSVLAIATVASILVPSKSGKSAH